MSKQRESERRSSLSFSFQVTKQEHFKNKENSGKLGWQKYDSQLETVANSAVPS